MAGLCTAALTFDLYGVHRDVWFSNMKYLKTVGQLLLALGGPAIHSHHKVVATLLPAEVALQVDRLVKKQAQD